MPFSGVEATFWAMLAPFVAAVLAPMLTQKLKHNAAWVLAAVPALIFVHFLSLVSSVAAGQTHTLGLEWVPTYGVTFSIYLDGLSTLFALLISGIGAFVVLYAGGYLKGHPQQGRFFSFLFLFMGSMLGVVLADNLITLFIFWELTSITSFLLIGFDNLRTASRRSAVQALVVTGSGGMALLAGFLLIGMAGGSMEMSEILASGDVLRDSGLYGAIFILVCLGAFTKSAQFPFHFWLPNAMEAPTPVSAYLHSATMVKAGVYLLMRLNPVLGDTALWTTVLPIFGGLTLLAGVIIGIRQTDLKLMLAYTTVASLGLLVMLTGASNTVAIKGAVLYLVAHSLFKGSLFMMAGTIDHEAGTRDITKLGGLRNAMPITFAAAVLAALSMAGLPPFLGFIAKEILYDGAYGTVGSGYLISLAALCGNILMFALAAAVALKPFMGEKVETPKHAHEGPILLWAGPITLAVSGLLLGLFAAHAGYFFINPMVSAVDGGTYGKELYLIPKHLNMALLMSVLTIALGIFAYLRIDTLRELVGRALTAIGWGPDRGFDQLMDGLVITSDKFIRTVQTGSMVTYMRACFIAVALMLFVPMMTTGNWPTFEGFQNLTFYEWAFVILAVIGLYAVITAKNRVTGIVSLGITGFSVAVIYTLFGAPDLSLTQFMVETLSVVILALVMTRLDLKPKDVRSKEDRVIDGVIAGSVGLGFAMLLMSVVSLPFDATLPEFFTQFSYSIAHGRNLVNVILVDFRGFDTIGEIAVVMVAGLAVLALIRVRAKKAQPKPEVEVMKEVAE
ncbi:MULTISPECIES: putative monovalent cation/H+ antiporter subunit A [Pseudovibrio]|uniref:putative monovalent cation/H+ antiporter subunit A n=1 Tax=Stappiaceae TaxID=2821832 RepID=UPI00236588CF|nr:MULTISPECIES: putative monovalent cation/H+ antiporter subunit A [Pseudovibrio]MDD7909174.1 putative monovalent cation/H+ antiporter subunit A [Pseudovibrio exalbescens]MDX5595619.1 putative monovalent cation/H+ antiporter subunit A [Pseudovibrio sp. SPO723]